MVMNREETERYINVVVSTGLFIKNWNWSPRESGETENF